ncbi:hypothetical protein AB0F96_15350 [Streptomyces sp. NPDC023998]|uniref:hypothetical protein n=1 Tax=Streptomyces sp. NPDC023998 TaxID=3154597 RepID=UPI0033F7C473
MRASAAQHQPPQIHFRAKIRLAVEVLTISYSARAEITHGAASDRPHVDICTKKRHGCLATPDGKGAFTFFRVMTGELIKKEGKSAPTAELRITYDR